RDSSERHEQCFGSDVSAEGGQGVRGGGNSAGGARADARRGAACAFEFQHAAVPFHLGGIASEKGNRSETVLGTDACGNGFGAGGCGGGHWFVSSDGTVAGRVDAQERLQRGGSAKVRAQDENWQDIVHARAIWSFRSVQVGD